MTEADGWVPGVIWISSVLEIDSGLVTDFTPGKAAFDLFVPALISFSVLLAVIPSTQLSFVSGPISLSASFWLLSPLLRLIHIEPHLSVCVLLTIIPFVQKISMEGCLRFVVGV